MNHAQPDARALAAAFREQQHLGTAPIADLVTMLEGVPYIHVAIEPEVEGDHHGMRASDPERGVTILGAAATPHAVRLRSTLAHELGHHLYNDPTPASWSDKTAEEDRATEFARHLLIPVDGLLELLGEPGTVEITEALLSKIVERFGVSPHMASIQLRDAGFIDATTATQFAGITTRVLATRNGWLALYRQWSADSRVVRPPRRIVASAISAYIEQAASIAIVANIQGTSPEAMRAELNAAGIVPALEDRQNRATEPEPNGDGDEVDWGALDDWDDAETEDETR